jgi:hypothetical protein
MMRRRGGVFGRVGAIVLTSVVAIANVAICADGDHLPLPSKEAARAATAKVREIFSSDAAKASTPEAKAKLAGELIGHARETEPPVEQYVLLDAARALAMEAGDVAVVMESLQMIAKRFAIDLPAARNDALEDLATKAPPTSLAQVADLLLDAASERVGEGDVAQAEDMVEAAVTAAAGEVSAFAVGRGALGDFHEEGKTALRKPCEETRVNGRPEIVAIRNKEVFHAFVGEALQPSGSEEGRVEVAMSGRAPFQLGILRPFHGKQRGGEEFGNFVLEKIQIV